MHSSLQKRYKTADSQGERPEKIQKIDTNGKDKKVYPRTGRDKIAGICLKADKLCQHCQVIIAKVITIVRYYSIIMVLQQMFILIHFS